MNQESSILKKLFVIGLASTAFGILTLIVGTSIGGTLRTPGYIGASILIILFAGFAIAYYLDKSGKYYAARRVLPYSSLFAISIAYFSLGQVVPLLIAFLIPITLGIVLLNTLEAIVLITISTIEAVVLTIVVNFLKLGFNIKLIETEGALIAAVATTLVAIPTISALMLIPIIERKAVEEKLSTQNERLSVVFSSIADGVITLNTSGSITMLNQVAEVLTGYSQQEAIGKPFGAVFDAQLLEKVYKLGEIVEFPRQTILLSLDGTKRYIAGTIAPTKDHKETIVGAVTVFRDITNQLRIDEELQKTAKLESLGLLAGGIAHDFNNILTVITGNISMAKIFELGSDEQTEALDEAEKATVRATGLARQLLTFAKGGDPIKSTVQIAELIKEAVSFATRGTNVEAGIVLSKELNTIEGDVGQLSQVIHNLVLNAVQAQPDGGSVRICADNITLAEGLNNQLPRGGYVRVSVQDWGVGIPSANLSKVFDPFFSTKPKGSGLGLATCFSIIRKHGGYIGVQSEAGEGTLFECYLPAYQQLVESPRTSLV